MVDERREFAGIFSHVSQESNSFGIYYYEPHAHLVNIKDFATGEHTMDHYMWKIGKTWQAVLDTKEGGVERGQIIKFRASLQHDRLLRPAKIEVIDD